MTRNSDGKVDLAVHQKSMITDQIASGPGISA